ncbi:FMN-dependent NADPH-azoreductase [Paenibacillus solanacearum]|uniref:FMN-dependent NADPH-azoreductase n=1 Tax=Paenibacillus solanacearum TaxID=2048548 RepID=A0A916NJC8_9BACL|nr:NADPH-dependent FMN reductase [Paenibacillus solanacearum]CAG7625179.1 FMN-dependent NADPH-azoreductase [Paenibacillus solanacearum]
MKFMIVSGSNRKDATSTQLCRYIERLLRESGHEAALFDLWEKPLPFYTKDSQPEDANVSELKQGLLEADGIVLATPEYHGSLSGVLKNALDFAGFDHFDGKIVLSVSSAGGAVGVSSLQHLQTIVRNVHGINCPEWISIGGAQRTFSPDGVPEDEKTRERVQRTLNYFTKMVRTFRMK